MRVQILSTARVTHVVVGAMIRRGATLALRGHGPKAFGSNMCDVCFPKRFRAPNNVIKYDDKTNLSVWLEDYHLECKAGMVDDDLFIIKFIPIYLADTARVSWFMSSIESRATHCWRS
jgi:hypothetical protein